MKINKERFDIIAQGVGEYCVKFGEFVLASSKKSPIYLDLRILRSHPKLLGIVAVALVEMTSELEYDLIADVPTAGTPIATVMSQIMGKPMITPRTPKEYGTKASIDGEYEKGQIVLVVDDLITGAESKLRYIRILEEEGLIVKDVAVLIDREQGGTEKLAEVGYALHAAFTINELLDFLIEKGLIAPELYDKAKSYFSGSK